MKLCPPNKEPVTNSKGVEKCYVRCKPNQRRNRKTMRCNVRKSNTPSHSPPLSSISTPSSRTLRRASHNSPVSSHSSLHVRSKITPGMVCPDGRELVVNKNNTTRCFKKCVANQSRNPSTLRCRKKSASRKKSTSSFSYKTPASLSVRKKSTSSSSYKTPASLPLYKTPVLMHDPPKNSHSGPVYSDPIRYWNEYVPETPKTNSVRESIHAYSFPEQKSDSVPIEKFHYEE